VPLPGHYKRMGSTPPPPAITTLTSPSIACFRVRSAHSTEHLLRRLFPTIARSCLTLRCPLLQPVSLTSVPSPFSSTAVRFRAQGRRSGRSLASLPWDGDRGPPWTGATRGPRARGLGPRISFRKIIPGNSNFGHFALRPLSFSEINPQSKNLQLGLRI
jgi:hypothetical protein